MSLCRTCLSNKDLRLIFPDKNLVSLRSKQLYLVCGIKIEPNDGFTQFICLRCLNLVNGAIKLRELSSKSEEILKKSIKIKNYKNIKKEIQISKKEPQKTKTIEQKQKKEIDISEEKKFVMKTESYETKNSDGVFSVTIEDFESSNDSDFSKSFVIPIRSSSPIDNKVCIEDYESNDSVDEDFQKIIKKDEKNSIKDCMVKDMLRREKKKCMNKAQDEKIMSLAAKPFDSRGPIRCTLCDKELKSLHTFKSHAKTHFEKQNSCEECGKKFLCVSHMRYHQQRVHGRRKRLACPKCSYRAVDQLQLQNHERAEHTGEKPFICDVCGDSFRMRSYIAQHMRKHFGVRNLQCERCPAMFRSRSELSGHQNRVHYLLYTYLCYLCPGTYKRLETVKKHILNVHGVQKNQQLPIKCIKTKRRNCEKSD